MIMVLTIMLGVGVVLATALSVIALCVLGLAQVRSFNAIAMRYMEICSGEGRHPDIQKLGGLARAMKPVRPLVRPGVDVRPWKRRLGGRSGD
ncbi:hypothetical protein [Crossiella sp. NPDC003009]